MAATEEASVNHPVTQMAKSEDPGLVDLSSQSLHKLDPNFCSPDTHTLILDQNHIIKLEHLEKNAAVQQLSVACNRLVRMMGVSKLTQLRVLNLPNNSIGYIEGLKDLVHLEWLNLAGNNIKVIEQLNSCVALQHLDLSDNNISHTGDLSKLSALKTLLLHGNIITSLRTSPAHFPPNLTVLSLAENEIRDLSEVSYLASLHNLEQLSIMNNPCVMATPSLPGCDYRPYVVSWCLNLKVLDGYVVSQKEGLKAEWLYSQGKGRMFRPGQHIQLVQYLASTCPLTSTSSLQSAEDAKLERILSKQRQHQKQLLQEGQYDSPSPLHPTQLDVDQHWTDPAQKGAATATTQVLNVISQSETSEPAVRVNTWMANTSSAYILSAVHTPSRGKDSLVLEDMQTDEEKLHGSLLSSESAFLPVSSVVHSPSPPDSEEEELDEPDSLAPPNPTRAHPQKVETATSFHLPLSQNHLQTNITDHTTEEGEHLLSDRMVHLQVNKVTNATEAGAELRRASAKVAECHSGEAAVKIQAWWRGYWTRQKHPQAKEVRCEIRLRRLQDHIVYLTAELERVQKQQQEEKLQRMIQEEAVKFLWKQLQAMMEWQCSVQEQLSCLSPSQSIAAGPIPASPKITALPMRSEVSIPESGFHSPGEQQGALEDSMSSAATADSPETVRTLQPTSSPGAGADGDSQDGSLLEQYLSSVQRQEEEEEDGERCTSLLSPVHGSEASSYPDGVDERQENTLLKAEL
ncbi:centrosomal protein of 97 kDa [Pangasianodon hypophthalmus]|uniref:centrosomal protein of 97 kDa n=1 Tax=Pangasianodon hypophthalmus TaxID=310915 RepID=UPI000EFE4DBC|nr:centrosomal protein of 97 kDa [Pangasianodon hypophthalmus]